MFQSILAIILKLVKRSKFYALRLAQSHYRTEVKVVFKKVREASLQNR